MKKLLLLVSVLVGLFMGVTPSFADSPVTSTDFYTAYMDVGIVKRAAEVGKVDSEIAKYLSTENNPTDVKAAVINALGWDYEGKNNTEEYLKLVYNKSLNELNFESLSGDELLNLGYLMVMDDYFEPERAIPVLEKAVNKKSDSLTISLINAIVKAQAVEGLNSKVWDLTNEVTKNKNLKKDMRTEAIRIIVDYMSLYSNDPVLNFYRQENIMHFRLGDPLIKINENQYEIDFGRGTKPELKNNSTFLPISPVIKAMGGSTEWDNQESKVTITLNSTKIELWIGKRTVVANGVTKQLSAAPYTSNSRTMLPLRFISENLGSKVDWDGQLKQITVTVSTPSYTATAVELWSVGYDLLGYADCVKEADYYFSESIKRDPTYVNSYVGKATALIWLEQYPEAINVSNKALALDPKKAEAYNIMSVAYTDMEMYNCALDNSNKAIELKPDFAEAYNAKGNALYGLERYQEAIENYDLAIKYDSTLLHPYNSKGNAFFALGYYKESIECYDQALKIDPNYAETYYNKGDSLYKVGRAQEAVQNFDKCIELDPEFAFAYYGKACALDHLNKTNDALASLKTAIELDEELKGSAEYDKEFENLKTNQTFLQLIK